MKIRLLQQKARAQNRTPILALTTPKISSGAVIKTSTSMSPDKALGIETQNMFNSSKSALRGGFLFSIFFHKFSKKRPKIYDVISPNI